MSEGQAKGQGQGNNPGWAGETGEFDLTEAEVRGIDYVGSQPRAGWEAGGVTAYPYQLAERDPEAPLFEGDYRTRLDRILARYPEKRAALLPVLNLVHEIRGHISPEAMEQVARLLEVSPAAVRGVATFYTMYNKAPVGRYLIQVCTNIGCGVCGGDEVLEAFLEHTGTDVGEISEDGNFTVLEVECLGACGFPTAVQINNRYFESVEAKDVPAILERLKKHGVDPVSGNGGRPARTEERGGEAAAPDSDSNSNSNSTEGEG